MARSDRDAREDAPLFGAMEALSGDGGGSSMSGGGGDGGGESLGQSTGGVGVDEEALVIALGPINVFRRTIRDRRRTTESGTKLPPASVAAYTSTESTLYRAWWLAAEREGMDVGGGGEPSAGELSADESDRSGAESAEATSQRPPSGRAQRGTGRPPLVSTVVHRPRGDGPSGRLSWLYAHALVIATDLNILVAMIDDGCTLESCPEYACFDEVYLCTAHIAALECCAVDAVTHTLDRASSELASRDFFPDPSRLRKADLALMRPVFTVFGRVLAHAVTSHRDVYDSFEKTHGTTARLCILAAEYRLLARPIIARFEALAD